LVIHSIDKYWHTISPMPGVVSDTGEDEPPWGCFYGFQPMWCYPWPLPSTSYSPASDTHHKEASFTISFKYLFSLKHHVKGIDSMRVCVHIYIHTHTFTIPTSKSTDSWPHIIYNHQFIQLFNRVCEAEVLWRSCIVLKILHTIWSWLKSNIVVVERRNVPGWEPK
jgi:hypothetical protein